MDSSIDYTKFSKLFMLEGVTKGKKIGIGAYGQVFEVMYRGGNFAAKFIHPILLSSVQSENRRIVNEVLRKSYSLSICQHPNIVRFIGLYYSATDDSIKSDLNSMYSNKQCPAMVMELMECSLITLIDQNQPHIALHKALSIIIT